MKFQSNQFLPNHVLIIGDNTFDLVFIIHENIYLK